MNISTLENLVSTASPAQKKTSEEAMRQTAQQFEAILLQQLTSAMNGTSEPDEDSLFGGDGGTDLAKKMFSEQMATTIAQSGGVGLADLIMQKFGAGKNNTVAAGKMQNLSNAITAVKDIKEKSEMKPLRSQNRISQLNSQFAKTDSVSDEISTAAADGLQSNSTGDDYLSSQNTGGFAPLTLDGKILNPVRPRIVPFSAITESGASAAVAAGSTISAPGSNSRVEFQMPVLGRISSGFGTRFHPIDRKTKFHSGIDIAVPKGSSIGAAADGVVKFAGWKGGYGYAVVVEHADGSETLYGHNEKLLVKEGDTVSAGETISLSGSTGKSTGPHLHFEIRKNGQAVDPENFLFNVLPKNADR